MLADDVRTLRQQHGWNQTELAKRLGVSQTLVSFWERGVRRVPPALLPKLQTLGFSPDATELPFRPEGNWRAESAWQELANLGYPGYTHLRRTSATWNPAQFLLMALTESSLDRRTAEGLPWVVCRYPKLDWDWLRREAKLRDLQNRLGFTLALSAELSSRQGAHELAAMLRQKEAALHDSLLAKEDTYGEKDMTSAERRWLSSNRSQAARRWNVLSDLEMEHLSYV